MNTRRECQDAVYSCQVINVTLAGVGCKFLFKAVPHRIYVRDLYEADDENSSPVDNHIDALLAFVISMHLPDTSPESFPAIILFDRFHDWHVIRHDEETGSTLITWADTPTQLEAMTALRGSEGNDFTELEWAVSLVAP